MNPLRALVLDLDGVLWGWQGVIADKARKALAAARERDIVLVIATGRHQEDADRVLTERGLDPKVHGFRAIVSDEQKIHFIEDGTYVPLRAWNEHRREQFARLYPLAEGILADAKGAYERRGLDGRWAVTGEEALNRSMVSLVFPTGEEADYVRVYVTERLPSYSQDLMCTRNLGLVTLMYRDGGKGRTLLEITNALGLAPAEVLAVGDSQADESMLDGHYGFRSATMNNAEAHVKQVVRESGGYVAQDFCGHGLAEILAREGLYDETA